MKRASFPLPARAARIAVVCAILCFSIAPAPLAAQDAPPAGEPVPAQADPLPESEAPVAPEAAPAGADVPTIPVDIAQEPIQLGVQLETIEVTGSRLRRTDFETAQPVLVITREDIERTGLTDLAQLLSKIPAAGNASLNTQAQARSTSLGETNLDLRNLGSTRTLLLVNGRRWANGLISARPSVADFNTIPTSIIERIEVLKDGASAIYGSDAIGGVVNVITRKDFAGWELTSQVGQYVAEGDGTKQQHQLAFGHVTDASSLFANLSYTEEQQALASNRDFTALPNPALGISRWGNSIPGGRFVFVPTSSNGTFYQCPNLQAGVVENNTGSGQVGQVGGTVGGTSEIPAGLQLCDLRLTPGAGGGELADYRQRDPNDIADRYNFHAKAVLQQPSERTSLFATASHRLAERLGLAFEALYTARRSTGVYGELILFGGDGQNSDAFISTANALNPWGQDIGNSQGTGFAPGYGFWVMRMPEEARTIWRFDNKADTLRLAWALNGDFDALGSVASWDAGYVTARAENDETSPLYRNDRLKLAVGPTAECTGDCVPLDVFHGEQGVTTAMLDYLYVNTQQHNESQQDIVYASASTSLDLPGRLLAGPLAAAAGLEFRQDEFSSVPDPIVQAGLTHLNQQQPLFGKSSAKEAFLELGVPLVKDMTGIQELEVSLAGRYSKYPGFGDVTTYKTGLRWTPVDGLLARATYSTGFRAPNIAELFLTPAQSFDPMSDPCITPSPQAQQNCTADGVNTDLAEQTAGSAYALWQGDPNLEPEESRNLTYGLVYSPAFVPDLNLYLDFYEIEVDDYITIGGTLAQFILDSCYEVPAEQRTYCGRVHRANSALVSVDTPYTNYSSVDTAGLDLGFDYLLPVPADFGRVKLALDASHLDRYDVVRPRPGQPSETRDFVGINDLLTGWPEWKAGSALTWKMDRYQVTWATRMAYKMTEPCVDSFTPPAVDFGVCSNPDPAVADDLSTVEVDEGKDDTSTNVWKTIFYHHLQLGYALPEYAADVTLGVNNVLDQDPQRSYGVSGFYWYNYDPQQYETPGRFGYVRIGVKF